MIRALPPLKLTTAFGKRSCDHLDQETIKKKQKTSSTGSGAIGVVDRSAMLKHRFSGIISKSQRYIQEHNHGMNKNLQEEKKPPRKDHQHEHEDEEKAAAMRRRRRVQAMKAQRRAARLELENVEKNANLQFEDNYMAFKELEKLSGCSLSCVVMRPTPTTTTTTEEEEENDDVRACAFQGRQRWNPLEKILGLTLKKHLQQEGDNHQELEEGELNEQHYIKVFANDVDQVVMKLKEKPHHYEEGGGGGDNARRSRRLQLESRRQAARLELQELENSVVIEENFQTFEQLQDLAGCSFTIMINPSASDDDAAKVTTVAFQGMRFWNPLERLGLHIKG